MSSVIDPIELLTDNGDRQPSFLNDKINPILFSACGFVTGCLLNWGFRKPVFSGIQKHVGLAAFGGFVGYYFDGKRTAYLARRDAVLRDYVRLHPDDFPPIQRKKYGEVLEPWVPIR